MSVNKVIIIGFLGQDPVIRQFKDGTKVANLSVATSFKYKSKNGETKEDTEWHRVSVFSFSAEFAEKYLSKGSQVYVEGRLRTRSYEDSEGIERWITEIIGERLQGLSRVNETQQPAQANKPTKKQSTQQPTSTPQANPDEMNEEVPF